MKWIIELFLNRWGWTIEDYPYPKWHPRYMYSFYRNENYNMVYWDMKDWFFKIKLPSEFYKLILGDIKL